MKNKAFVILLFSVPVVLVFKNYFLAGSLAAGDAPYLFQNVFLEFLREPLAWTNRGIAFGGPNQLLWLSPLMALYAGLGNLLGNDIAVRLVFYFPSLILALIGVTLLANKFRLSSLVTFFACLLYICNTYYILLIDGGQVGVALAYGLFPVTLFFLIQLFEKPGLYQWVVAFIASLALVVIDPRVALICFFTSIFWLRKKALKTLVLLLIALVASSLYWILPFLQNGSGASGLQEFGQPISLLHSLLLYQPHWPENIFGVTNPPLFYFALFPVFLVLGVVSARTKQVYKMLFLTILFAYLAQATLMFGNLPFGFVFRDTTKFFVPLMLVSSLLFSQFLDTVKNKTNRTVFSAILYIFVLLTVLPALSGQMKLVLSKTSQTNDYQTIGRKIAENNDFARVVWFPSTVSQSFETQTKPALSGRDIADFRLFANMNTGSSDRFNFMKSHEYINWFRLFGIRHLVFAGDARNTKLTNEAKAEWYSLLDNTSKFTDLKKQNWSAKIPVYTIENPAPYIIGSDAMVIVVGNMNSVSPAVPMTFVEDGNFNPLVLKDVVGSAAYLYFDNRTDLDFQMSMLNKHFISTSEAKTNQWSVWDSNDYLKYKYELLIRDFDVKELDYQKGISFSTQPEELISYSIKKPKGEYMIAVRAMSKEGSTPLRIVVNNHESEFSSDSHYKWFIKQATNSENIDIKIENKGGMWVVNTIAVIPISEWVDAERLANDYLQKFNQLNQLQLEKLLAQNHWKNIEFSTIGASRITVQPTEGIAWIMLNEKYHPLWNMRRNTDYFHSLSTYAAMNSYYLPSSWGKSEIVFRGQENFRWGIYWSAVSLLATICVVPVVYDQKNKS